MSDSQLEVQPEFSIHPKTLIGEVSLTVANLERQIAFYRDVVGLSLLQQDAHSAALGAAAVGGGPGRTLVRLTEEPGFKRYRGVTGLYHFAVLFPNQRELARALGRLIALQYPNSPTDHIMTKTTYLDDPEGNGIELYAESPEDGAWSMADGQYVTRRADGSISSGREPLDIEAAAWSPDEGRPAGRAGAGRDAHAGHVHLHVRNVEEAVDFYHGVLGFDVQGNARAFRMAFVSAGGYHHHIGLNTWQGEGAPVAAGRRAGNAALQRAAARQDRVGARGQPRARNAASRWRKARRACWCEIRHRMGCC